MFIEQVYKVNDQEIQPAYRDNHLWVTSKDMAQILGVKQSVTHKHIQKLTKLGQIGCDTTLWNYKQLRIEGNRKVIRTVPYYSEKVVILVAFRSNSPQALAFQSWAADILLELNNKRVVFKNQELEKQVTDLLARLAKAKSIIDKCHRALNEYKMPWHEGDLPMRVVAAANQTPAPPKLLERTVNRKPVCQNPFEEKIIHIIKSLHAKNNQWPSQYEIRRRSGDSKSTRLPNTVITEVLRSLKMAQIITDFKMLGKTSPRWKINETE